jgi:hypothetical protein
MVIRRSVFHVVVACLCGVAAMAGLVDAAESLLRPDPAFMVAQRPAAPATAEPTTTGWACERGGAGQAACQPHRLAHQRAVPE